MPEPSLAVVTPYDRLTWSDDEIEALLASGERRRELVAVFGADFYADLASLARMARRIGGARGPRVWLLPGIMGSRLGKPRSNAEPADTLWLDPLDVIGGRLVELACTATPAAQSLGILHFSYLRLKLALTAAGYAVRCFDYDWRAGVEPLGAKFAQCLRQEDRDFHIVAHSMGGLVARAALQAAVLPRLQRLVLLGTPNNGSWATVQALRGTYSVVRRLAQLDRLHDARRLAAEVFHGFQCLYDLLPGAATGEHRWLDLDAWPSAGLRPDRQRLKMASQLSAALAAADERCICIVGQGEPTVVAAQVRDQITYTVSRAGDGTVATAAAKLDGARCYFARCNHSQLTRAPEVAHAIADVLRHGETQRLSDRELILTDSWQIDESELWALPSEKIDWARMSIEARRVFLDNLNEPLPGPAG